MSSIKILHRIYFGFDGKPDIYQDYLNTWKEQLPGYDIKYWNASNLPMDCCPYVEQLYKRKDPVFLGDYFRWWLLREYGGIYLDADIEITDGQRFNAIIEELEKSPSYEAVIGVEKADWGYTAHSMASKPASDISRFMCGLYENMGNLYHWRKRFLAPELTQLYFFDLGLVPEPKGAVDIQEPTVLGGVKIYPQEYFSPLGYGPPPFLEKYTKNTCLCHHFGAAWVDENHPAFFTKNKMQRRRKMLADYLKEQSVVVSQVRGGIRNFAAKFLRLFRKILGTARLINEISSLHQRIEGREWQVGELQKILEEQQKQIGAQQKKIEMHLSYQNRVSKALLFASLREGRPAIFYLGTPEHGNLGDQAIAAASLSLLQSLYPGYALIEFTYNDWLYISPFIIQSIRTEDLIFLLGGGNMGNLWVNEEELRRSIVKQFPNNRIISMLQSVSFSEDPEGCSQLKLSQDIYNVHPDLTLMGRDELSFSRIKKYFPGVKHSLAPDTVLFWEESFLEKYRGGRRDGVLFVLRRDKEKNEASSGPVQKIQDHCLDTGIPHRFMDTVLPRDVDILRRNEELTLLFQEFAESRLVITDRYHGLIFSVLTSTPCIVYKSLDHKISEGVKWFSHLDWIHYAPEEEAVPGLIKHYTRENPVINHPLRFTQEMLDIYRNMQ